MSREKDSTQTSFPFAFALLSRPVYTQNAWDRLLKIKKRNKNISTFCITWNFSVSISRTKENNCKDNFIF